MKILFWVSMMEEMVKQRYALVKTKLSNHVDIKMKMAVVDKPKFTVMKSKESNNQKAEQILNEYGNSILRLAYSYLHNMNDAEDILQDTLIQFLKNAPVFANKPHEKTWLLQVAGNLSKNKIQYNTRHHTDELSETLFQEEREDLSYVWDAVKELSVKEREVIHLYYYEGYSTVQIAEILNKKESTIRSNLHRGRERLKEILEKGGYDFDETL